MEFYEQDKKENIGQKFVVALETKFDSKGLRFSRQSFGVFPRARISPISLARMRTASTSFTSLGMRPVLAGMTLRSIQTPDRWP